MMTPYRSRAAKQNLQAGLGKMEKSLTPIQRAWRAIAAGRPPSELKLDAINGLASVCNLRDRLEKTLKDSRGEITSAAIAFTCDAMPPDTPAATVLLARGKENEALAFMLRCKTPPSVLGAFFAVRDGQEKRLFVYPLDRSPEAIEKLEWLKERQLSGAALRSTN
jgi:hypothetical protein